MSTYVAPAVPAHVHSHDLSFASLLIQLCSIPFDRNKVTTESVFTCERVDVVE